MRLNRRPVVRFRGGVTGLALLALCVVSGLGATNAAAAEHSYRNLIGTRLGTPPRYFADHADGANFTADAVRKSHWQAVAPGFKTSIGAPFGASDGARPRPMTAG